MYLSYYKIKTKAEYIWSFDSHPNSVVVLS